VSAQITRVQPGAADLRSQVTLTARPDDRTRSGISLQIGQFELAVDYSVTRPTAANLALEATCTTQADVILVTGSEMQCETQADVTVFRVLIGQADLVAAGFQVSAGDIINFDPVRDIRVDAESRIITVLKESRVLTVEYEMRSTKIHQETRVLRVSAASRVNIINP
jgi:hypothetical protein